MCVWGGGGAVMVVSLTLFPSGSGVRWLGGWWQGRVENYSIG